MFWVFAGKIDGFLFVPPVCENSDSIDTAVLMPMAVVNLATFAKTLNISMWIP